jgi:hypothetical protein
LIEFDDEAPLSRACSDLRGGIRPEQIDRDLLEYGRVSGVDVETRTSNKEEVQGDPLFFVVPVGGVAPGDVECLLGERLGWDLDVLGIVGRCSLGDPPARRLGRRLALQVEPAVVRALAQPHLERIHVGEIGGGDGERELVAAEAVGVADPERHFGVGAHRRAARDVHPDSDHRRRW